MLYLKEGQKVKDWYKLNLEELKIYFDKVESELDEKIKIRSGYNAEDEIAHYHYVKNLLEKRIKES